MKHHVLTAFLTVMAAQTIFAAVKFDLPARLTHYDYPCTTQTVDGVIWRYDKWADSSTNWYCIGGRNSYDGWTSAVDTSQSGAITIPSEIDGNTILEIAPHAFYRCDNLTRITVPSSIKYVGSFAFPSNNTLKVIRFEGDAPNYLLYGDLLQYWETYGSNPFSGNFNMTIYVMPTSTGWNTSIPGTYMGRSIKYLKSVDFDANGGNVSESIRWFVDGDAVGSLPIPTRTQAVFNGWYTAQSGGTQIEDSMTVWSNVTVYAQWTMNQYTVVFDANEGVGGKSLTQDWGTEIGTIPEPTRTGYFFNGWFTDKAGGTKVELDSSSKVEEDVTYYAQWERDPIPEMVSGETVAEVLDGAADTTLAAKLGTVRNYKSFRSWVDENSLAHKDVFEAPNAWLSYVLDAPGLIAKKEALKRDDFALGRFSKSASTSGSIAFEFVIDGVEIGEEAELDEAFEVVGSTTLEDASFTDTGITASISRTDDGSVSVDTTPPKDSSGKTPDAYFFKVRVK